MGEATRQGRPRTNRLFLAFLLASTPAQILIAAQTGLPKPAGIAEAGLIKPAGTKQPMLLTVNLNGQQQREPTLVIGDGQGGIWVNQKDLETWRIRTPGCTEPEVFEDATHCRLDSTPDVKVAYAEDKQTLTITAAAELFERQSAGFAQEGSGDMTPSATGAFLNYDITAERSKAGTSGGGYFESGLFNRHGTGILSFVASSQDKETRYQFLGLGLRRLETYWLKDNPGNVTSLKLGDSITRGGDHITPSRFAGIQYSRNFATQPGYITLPLPSLTGSSAVPNVIDVYVNNQLRGTRNVQPGPFDITDIPVDTGGGNVQIAIRDVLGRQVLATQSYYASPELLRKGLHDFSYEAGFERQNYGLDSFNYGKPFVSGFHRYGLTNNFTIHGTAHLTARSQAASTGASLALPQIGVVSATGALSRSPGGIGKAASGAFERKTISYSLGARAEYNSRNYAAHPDFWKEQQDPLYTTPIPKLTAQLYTDMPIGPLSLGMSALHRRFYGKEPTQNLYNLFTTVRMSRKSSLQLYARYITAEKKSYAFGGHYSIAFGPRTSGSLGFQHSREDPYLTASYQRSVPFAEGSGYRITATKGNVDSIHGSYQYNSRIASTIADVAITDNGGAAFRLTTRGAVGIIGSTPFASRAIGNSFGLVHLPGYKDVKVYADNQLIGTTNKNGILLLPTLRAYENNYVRLADSDLPIEVQITPSEIRVKPYARAGTVVRFNLKRERGVMLTVRSADGKLLPPGTDVSIKGTNQTFIAVTGGKIYIPDLTGTHIMTAAVDGERCAFTVTVPENDDPQPSIEGLICKQETSLAH